MTSESQGPAGALVQMAAYVYNADGTVSITTDEAGETTTFGYNDLGEKISETKSDGTQTVETDFEYDPDGELTAITTPDGDTTNYTYDELGRKTAESVTVNGNTLTRSYAYDWDGNLISYTDRDGRTTTYQYDEDNQLIEEDSPGTGGGSSYTATYAYDAEGRQISAQDNDSGYTYTYDVLGRVTQMISQAGFSVAYTYNTDDQVTERDIYGTGSSPLVVDTYAYDGEGRPTGISESGSAVAAKSFGYTYVAPDQPHAGMLANVSRSLDGTEVLNTVYTYDDKERLTDIAHYGLGHSDPIAEYGYTFDTADRIASFTPSLDGQSQTDESRTYFYDSTGQLLAATDPNDTAAESYSYDANGNRTGTGNSVGDNNEVLSDGTYDYTYDNEGNRTSRTNISTGVVDSYTWDSRNRLAQVQEADGSTVVFTVDYTYDVDNQLIGRTVTEGTSAPVTERFAWIDGQMVFRTDTNGEILNHYSWGLGTDELLADEQYSPSTGALDHVYFTLGDAQGTPRDIAEVVAGSTNIVNHRQFDSFGNLLAQSDSSIDEIFGSQGTYRDPLTNLDYHRARWLDPVTGRWMNEDPLEFAAGDSNTSRDTNNDPINEVDPSGLVGSNYSKNFFDALTKSLGDANSAVVQLLSQIQGSKLPDGRTAAQIHHLWQQAPGSGFADWLLKHAKIDVHAAENLAWVPQHIHDKLGEMQNAFWAQQKTKLGLDPKATIDKVLKSLGKDQARIDTFIRDYKQLVSQQKLKFKDVMVLSSDTIGAVGKKMKTIVSKADDFGEIGQQVKRVIKGAVTERKMIKALAKLADFADIFPLILMGFALAYPGQAQQEALLAVGDHLRNAARFGGAGAPHGEHIRNAADAMDRFLVSINFDDVARKLIYEAILNKAAPLR